MVKGCGVRMGQIWLVFGPEELGKSHSNSRSQQQGEIKGINPSDSAESGLYAGIKGINAPEFTGCGPNEQMRGISAPEFTGSGPNEQMRSISAPHYAGCRQK
ncbi:hypothetical protein QW71_05590 [Paenibacillus sp. IHB B 3415]|nr:hypothetical protein QW71_05590 [Paenibacillus sp. IHB B 3415]